MKLKGTFIAIAVLLLAFACKKDKTEEPTTSPGATSVVFDVHNDIANWRYFSFALNSEVTISNFDDTLGWDLGIHYESFRTNGGASGIGQGSVVDLGAVNFDNVTLSSIGGNTFTPDDSIKILATSGMPPTWDTVPGCELMEAMFASPAGPPPHTYTPNNHVYVIHTANGRHVKFIGTSFFNDLGVEGYLNFKYAFLD